jgi:DNA primase
MNGRSSDVIERVRAATDIVDLVGRYVQLKKSGQSFKARCPFHEEKTPSFHVQPARQTFHCFGCGQKGGVFDFIMGMERVEFKDALALLADQAGITLVAHDGSLEERTPKADLYRLHEWAAHFYARALRSKEGQACRDYLKSRGILASSVDAFNLGFAPGGWRALLTAADAVGFSRDLLIAGGLAIAHESGTSVYDAFRERLMFPIRDALGRVVAFGGRSLDGAHPKYINSPDTPLFSKGRLLYGVDRLKRHPRVEPVFVMEGYTDVLMSHQVGVTGSVATLGTALTGDQAKLVARYSDQVVMVYDGDSAGLAGAEKAAMELLAQGLVGLRVVALPEGRDPFDHFAIEGAQGIVGLVEGAKELLDFLLARALLSRDAQSLEGRRQAALRLLQAAARVEEPLTRDLLLHRISDKLALPLPVLRAQLEGLLPRRSRTETAAATVRSAPERVRGIAEARRQVMEALLNEPSLLQGVRQDFEGNPKRLLGESLAGLLGVLMQQADLGNLQVGLLMDAISQSDLREYGRALLLPEDHKKDLRAQLEGAIQWLKNRHNLEETRNLAAQLSPEGSPDLLEDLQRRYRSLKGKGD